MSGLLRLIPSLYRPLPCNFILCRCISSQHSLWKQRQFSNFSECKYASSKQPCHVELSSFVLWYINAHHPHPQFPSPPPYKVAWPKLPWKMLKFLWSYIHTHTRKGEVLSTTTIMLLYILCTVNNKSNYSQCLFLYKVASSLLFKMHKTLKNLCVAIKMTSNRRTISWRLEE